MPTPTRLVRPAAVSAVVRWATAGALIALALIVIAEIDRAISAVVSPEGESRSLASVTGLLALGNREAWAVWAAGDDADRVALWILCSVLADFVFILLYGRVILAFIRRWVTVVIPDTRTGGSGEVIAAASTLRRVTTLLIGADLLEGLLLLIGAWLLHLGTVGPDGFAVVAWAVGIFATIKWTVCALLLLTIVRNRTTRGALAMALRRGWRALWLHRLSALPVLLLAAFACVPRSGVFDQLPDIQRQWTAPAGWWHLVFAGLAVALSTLVAFLLGRGRTRRAVERFAMPDHRKVERSVGEVAKWWMIPIVAWVVLAVLTVYVLAPLVAPDDPSRTFSPWLIVVFLGVPLLVLGVSLIVQRYHPRFPTDPFAQDHGRVRDTWLTGDLLAAMLPVVGGLGLARSMTLPIAIGFADRLPSNRMEAAVTAGELAGAAALAAIALLGIAGGPRLLSWWNPHPGTREAVADEDGVAQTPPAPTGMLRAELQPSVELVAPGALTAPRSVAPEGRVRADGSEELRQSWARHQRVWLTLMITAGALLLALLLFPGIAALFGPVATMVLVITCWTAVLGSFAVALQAYHPLPIFRVLRLKATPVLTLGMVVPLIAGSITSVTSADGVPHAIRTLSATAEACTEPDGGDPGACADPFAFRIAENTCEIRVGSATVRPVLLVAAEGGGVRAAYWTRTAMERVLGAGCLGSSVLVSSGASGGSVGLSLTGVVDSDRATGPELDDAKAQLDAISDAGTLAQAISGLLVGDVVATSFGVQVPSFVPRPHDPTTGAALELPGGAEASEVFGWRWRDRAALIETGWISSVPGLGGRFGTAANPATGVTLLNSTEADTGCRVVVGNSRVAGDRPTTSIDTGEGGASATADAASPRIGCDGPGVQPGKSWWLPDDCAVRLDLATATMLSARFPIVTPSGRLDVAGCTYETQLIDGGYAENSALGTLADLAPEIAAAIGAANADAAETGAANTGTAPSRVYAVPIVVYLRNSAGYDISDTLSKLTAEPLVPIVGHGAKLEQVSDTAWLQRLSASLQHICPASGDAGETPCEAAVRAVRGKLPGQVVVVAPETRPTVVPPLGWTLSSFSARSLDLALDCLAPRAGDELPPASAPSSCRAASPGSWGELRTLIGLAQAE